MDRSPKRRYRNNLAYVEHGFRACWQNAQDLIRAAKELLDNGLHAPALSLSVLAIEELAKLCAIDGLLFARPNDNKAERFTKANKSHDTKLDMFTLFPLMIGSLMQTDARTKDQRFAQAMAITMHQFKADGNAVLERLPGGFTELDHWKQRGFYATTTGTGFTAPRDTIDPAFARQVYQLAWRATTTIDFLLKDGNLERYLQTAQTIRQNLSEEQHQALERLGDEITKELFDGTEQP